MNNGSGRVEVCSKGTWGTVCEDNFNDNDADYVCGALGFQKGDETNQWCKGIINIASFRRDMRKSCPDFGSSMFIHGLLQWYVDP